MRIKKSDLHKIIKEELQSILLQQNVELVQEKMSFRQKVAGLLAAAAAATFGGMGSAEAKPMNLWVKNPQGAMQLIKGIDDHGVPQEEFNQQVLKSLEGTGYKLVQSYEAKPDQQPTQSPSVASAAQKTPTDSAASTAAPAAPQKTSTSITLKRIGGRDVGEARIKDQALEKAAKELNTPAEKLKVVKTERGADNMVTFTISK